MKDKIDAVIALIIVMVFGCGFLTGKVFGERYPEPEAEPTCETVALEMTAFQDCLAARPACTSVGVTDFIRYHEQKNWVESFCPNSGDD